MLASAITISLSTYAQNWKLDPSHSKINFTAKYLVISDVDGEFKKFDGTFTSTKGDFSDLQLSVSADVNSISTENDMRDKHLMSDDFFNADKFPKITFVSKGIKSLGNNKFMLSGTLTVRDVTKNVEIPLVYGGTVTDPWGNVKAGFKASGTINRKDYGLKYANAAATGEAVVGDNVEFIINAILIKQ
ncbi:MAG: YceI family protein [Bacteroidetes bacterium]|nr:YceI family protein [Bacteroidota bacterium]